MNFLTILAFLLIVIAILLFFKINSNTIKESIQITGKQSLKKLTEKKKKSKLAISIQNILTALNVMGETNKFNLLILLSFFLIIIGITSGISLNNVFLVPVLSIILASIPFIFVRVQYIEYNALIVDELEVGLSVITSSIERTENILQGFKENIENINEPLKSIFIQFIYAVEHNIDIPDAIDIMKVKIPQASFLEWCDNLKQCNADRTLKSTLRPVVNKISNIKVASSEAKNILFQANAEFKAVSLISIIFLVLTYFVIPSSLGNGIQLPFSDFLLAVDILMLFFFYIRALLLTRDIKFDM